MCHCTKKYINKSLLHTSHLSPAAAVTAGSSDPFFSSVCASASFVSSDRETTTLSCSPGTTTFTPRWASSSLANSVITAHLERRKGMFTYKHTRERKMRTGSRQSSNSQDFLSPSDTSPVTREMCPHRWKTNKKIRERKKKNHKSCSVVSCSCGSIFPKMLKQGCQTATEWWVFFVKRAAVSCWRF